MRSIQNLPDFTIAINAADSNIMLRNEFEDAIDILLLSASAISGGGTPVIQVTYDDVPSSGGNWVTLQKAAADVVPPAAGKAKSISDDNNAVPPCSGIRIHGTANFTTQITVFKVFKTVDQS